MSIDPYTLPACTQEDGSDPGQLLPCHWDAALMGNGIGQSFVINADGTFTYDDTAPATPVVAAEPEPVAVTGSEDQPVSPPNVAETSQVLVLDGPPPAELAHTGADGLWWVAAALLVAVGTTMVRVGRTRSS